MDDNVCVYGSVCVSLSLCVCARYVCMYVRVLSLVCYAFVLYVSLRINTHIPSYTPSIYTPAHTHTPSALKQPLRTYLLAVIRKRNTAPHILGTFPHSLCAPGQSLHTHKKLTFNPCCCTCACVCTSRCRRRSQARTHCTLTPTFTLRTFALYSNIHSHHGVIATSKLKLHSISMYACANVPI